MSYWSRFYQIKVRDAIARDFSNSRGEVDDMLAGLHEIRARLSRTHPVLKAVARRLAGARRTISRQAV